MPVPCAAALTLLHLLHLLAPPAAASGPPEMPWPPLTEPARIRCSDSARPVHLRLLVDLDGLEQPAPARRASDLVARLLAEVTAERPLASAPLHALLLHNGSTWALPFDLPASAADLRLFFGGWGREEPRRYAPPGSKTRRLGLDHAAGLAGRWAGRSCPQVLIFFTGLTFGHGYRQSWEVKRIVERHGATNRVVFVSSPFVSKRSVFFLTDTGRRSFMQADGQYSDLRHAICEHIECPTSTAPKSATTPSRKQPPSRSTSTTPSQTSVTSLPTSRQSRNSSSAFRAESVPPTTPSATTTAIVQQSDDNTKLPLQTVTSKEIVDASYIDTAPGATSGGEVTTLETSVRHGVNATSPKMFGTIAAEQTTLQISAIPNFKSTTSKSFTNFDLESTTSKMLVTSDVDYTTSPRLSMTSVEIKTEIMPVSSGVGETTFVTSDIEDETSKLSTPSDFESTTPYQSATSDEVTVPHVHSTIKMPVTPNTNTATVTFDVKNTTEIFTTLDITNSTTHFSTPSHIDEKTLELTVSSDVKDNKTAQMIATEVTQNIYVTTDAEDVTLSNNLTTKILVTSDVGETTPEIPGTSDISETTQKMPVTFGISGTTSEILGISDFSESTPEILVTSDVSETTQKTLVTSEVSETTQKTLVTPGASETTPKMAVTSDVSEMTQRISLTSDVNEMTPKIDVTFDTEINTANVSLRSDGNETSEMSGTTPQITSTLSSSDEEPFGIDIPPKVPPDHSSDHPTPAPSTYVIATTIGGPHLNVTVVSGNDTNTGPPLPPTDACPQLRPLLAELRQRLTVCVSVRHTLARHSATLQRRAESCELRLSNKTSSATALAARNRWLTRRNALLGQELLAAMQRLQEMTRVGRRLTERVADLEEEVEETDEAHERTLGELERVRRLLKAAGHRCAVLEEQVSKLDAARMKLVAELAVQRRQSEFTSVKTELERRLALVEAKTQKLERRRVRLQRQLLAAEQEIRAVKAEADHLKQQVEARASILVFKLRSGTGITFAEAYYSNAFYSTEDRTLPVYQRLYKSEKLRYWTKGRYRRVSLVLRRDGRPVVRVEFDGRFVDRYNWFNSTQLVRGFPWSADILKQLGTVHIGSATSDTHLSVLANNSTCRRPRAFLAVVDSADSCYWTWSHSRGRFPLFLYTVRPDGLPGDFNSHRVTRAADTLEIRVTPHVVFDPPPNAQHPNFAEWDALRQHLVFAVTAGSGVNVGRLWSGRLFSPPQRLSENRLLNSDWFRSFSLQHWLPDQYRRALVSMVSREGKILAALEFDVRGTERDDWFTMERLQSSWPWTARDIRRNRPNRFWIHRANSSLSFVLGSSASEFSCTDRGFFAVSENTDLHCISGVQPMMFYDPRPEGRHAALLQAGSRAHQLRVSLL